MQPKVRFSDDLVDEAGWVEGDEDSEEGPASLRFKGRIRFVSRYYDTLLARGFGSGNIRVLRPLRGRGRRFGVRINSLTSMDGVRDLDVVYAGCQASRLAIDYLQRPKP